MSEARDDKWDALRAMLPGFTPPADGKIRGVVMTAPPDIERIERLRDATPRTPDGYDTPVYVVHPDADADAIGAAVAGDAHPGRFRVFGGTGCVEAFAEWLGEHDDRALPRDLLGRPNEALTGRVLGAVEAAYHAQSAVVGELTTSLKGGPESAADAKAWERIRSGDGAARVLVITSRFTTYLQHTARDLAQSFQNAGHTVELLMEPDSACVLNAAHYLRTIESLRPDLVIGINFPRATMGAAVPDGWPFVCWVQDAMGHMFGLEPGSAGPLDFIAGHVYSQALERAGYPGERVLEYPVCVSTSKFHAGEATAPGDPVDIAYISHRSETAEAMARSLVSMFGAPASVADKLLSMVSDAIDRWSEPANEYRVELISRDLGAQLGGADGSRADLVRTQLVLPVAEQMLRERMLTWAASIADRRGLTLGIYGNGWESNTTFARFARGPLEHGDALRSCYQRSGVLLHGSVLGCGHQRIYECALSGGLPLCVRSIDELYRHDVYLARHFLRSGAAPDASFVHNRAPAYRVSEHPALMSLLEFRQRVRTPPRGWEYWDDRALFGDLYDDDRPRPFEFPLMPERALPVSILGDPFETTFEDEVELERLVARAVEKPEWRASVSDGMRRRVLERVSMGAFASDMLAMVGRGVASGGVQTPGVPLPSLVA